LAAIAELGICQECSTTYFPQSNAQRYCDDCGLKIKKRRHQAFIKQPEQRLKRRLYKLGISVEQYQSTLQLQGGVCAVCKKLESRRANGSGRLKALSQDHNHQTNRSRGIICQDCNLAIGFLSDDPELAEALTAYLRKWLDD